MSLLESKNTCHLFLTPEGDTVCFFPGCVLYKYPQRQNLEQRPSVPLLTRLAGMQETPRELSPNTHKLQRDRLLPSQDSSHLVPGKSTGQSGQGCFRKRKSSRLILRDGGDNLTLWLARPEECLLYSTIPPLFFYNSILKHGSARVQSGKEPCVSKQNSPCPPPGKEML